MPRLKFAGVQLGEQWISFQGQDEPVEGVRAHVEDRGMVVRPGTPLAWPVTVVARSVLGVDRGRDVVLVVEGRDFTFVVPCPPHEFSTARRFAAEVCAAGAGRPLPPEHRQAGPGFPRSEIGRTTLSRR